MLFAGGGVGRDGGELGKLLLYFNDLGAYLSHVGLFREGVIPL